MAWIEFNKEEQRIGKIKINTDVSRLGSNY